MFVFFIFALEAHYELQKKKRVWRFFSAVILSSLCEKGRSVAVLHRSSLTTTLCDTKKKNTWCFHLSQQQKSTENFKLALECFLPDTSLSEVLHCSFFSLSFFFGSFFLTIQKQKKSLINIFFLYSLLTAILVSPSS